MSIAKAKSLLRSSRFERALDGLEPLVERTATSTAAMSLAVEILVATRNPDAFDEVERHLRRLRRATRNQPAILRLAARAYRRMADCVSEDGIDPDGVLYARYLRMGKRAAADYLAQAPKSATARALVAQFSTATKAPSKPRRPLSADRILTNLVTLAGRSGLKLDLAAPIGPSSPGGDAPADFVLATLERQLRFEWSLEDITACAVLTPREIVDLAMKRSRATPDRTMR